MGDAGRVELPHRVLHFLPALASEQPPDVTLLRRRLVTVRSRRPGVEQRLVPDPAWSPDGTRIAFASTRGPLIEGFPLYDMYVMNTDGSGVTRVPSGLMSASYPSWSPDGTRIAFVATADWNLYPSQVYVMNTNGSALTPSLTVYQPRPGTYSMWYAGDPAWRPPRP